ncbi:hypothetical protein ACG2F4_18805 [Halalkalibaculum sp. DA3122]|uniref:hypothetical protein n=1 Tax=Halalkalibaculum sp. DA3122 TaxID=3373607 RepID=UPI003754F446
MENVIRKDKQPMLLHAGKDGSRGKGDPAKSRNQRGFNLKWRRYTNYFVPVMGTPTNGDGVVIFCIIRGVVTAIAMVSPIHVAGGPRIP